MDFMHTHLYWSASILPDAFWGSPVVCRCWHLFCCHVCPFCLTPRCHPCNVVFFSLLMWFLLFFILYVPSLRVSLICLILKSAFQRRSKLPKRFFFAFMSLCQLPVRWAVAQESDLCPLTLSHPLEAQLIVGLHFLAVLRRRNRCRLFIRR